MCRCPGKMGSRQSDAIKNSGHKSNLEIATCFISIASVFTLWEQIHRLHPGVHVPAWILMLPPQSARS